MEHLRPSEKNEGVPTDKNNSIYAARQLLQKQLLNLRQRQQI
jgi:hypothetical protein